MKNKFFLLTLLSVFCFTQAGALANVEKRVALEDIPKAEGTYVITIEVDEVAQLNFTKVNRFLITSSGIVEVSPQETHSLLVKGSKIGNTFLHVWEPEGRKTVKLIVKRKKLPESTVEKRYLDQLKKKDTFKIGLEYEFVTTDIGSEFNDTKNDFMRHDYRITLSGDSPYGFIYGFARFQDFGGTPFEDAYTDGTLRFANFSSKTRIGPYPSSGPYPLDIGPHAPVGPLQDFTVILGDNFYNITPFTAPWSLARGTFLYQTVMNEKLDYLLLWTQDQEEVKFLGASGETIDAPDHFYTGGDFTYHLNEWLDFGGTFLVSYGDREDTVSNHVAAANFYADFDWITFDGEIAQTEDEIAWRAGTDMWRGDNYHLGALYRDIDEDFFAINGQTVDRGEKGVLVKADADPFPFLHVETTLDRYQDRLFPSETDPDGYNTDFILRGRINLPWRTYFTGTYRDADNTGSLLSREESSYSFQLNKTFSRPRGLGVFARYERREVDNNRSSLLGYDRDSVKVGARWQVFPGLSIGATQEWAEVESTDDPFTLIVPPPRFPFSPTTIFTPVTSFPVSERTSPSRFTADINYYTQIGETPFYIDFRFRWEDEEDTESINSFFAGEDTVQGEAELAYIPSDYFKAFARGRLEDRKSEIDGEEDLVEAELIVGANVIFDTGITWDPQGMIKGIVFKDLNGNGVLDKGEEGIPNIDVLLSNEDVSKTDEKGVFDFGKIRGKLFRVTIDLQSVPAGYINTTPFSQDISIRQGKVSDVYFGIIARSGIRGIVFNDVNGNGFLDGEDKGLPKVVVKLDGKRESVTDAEGRYYFENVGAGEHEIALVLDSLPLNFVPKVAIKQKITVNEGRMHTRYFPVQATREISGKVFDDKNKNGVFDKGEKGLERMMVAIGPNLVLTDGQGKFRFKNLPSGKHIVELRNKGIPKGYQLSSPGTQIVELGEEISEVTGIHFGLKQ